MDSSPFDQKLAQPERSLAAPTHEQRPATATEQERWRKSPNQPQVTATSSHSDITLIIGVAWRAIAALRLGGSADNRGLMRPRASRRKSHGHRSVSGHPVRQVTLRRHANTRTRRAGHTAPAFKSNSGREVRAARPVDAVRAFRNRRLFRHDETGGGTGGAAVWRVASGRAASSSQSSMRRSSAAGGDPSAAARSASVSSTAHANT